MEVFKVQTHLHHTDTQQVQYMLALDLMVITAQWHSYIRVGKGAWATAHPERNLAHPDSDSLAHPTKYCSYWTV